MRTIDERFIIQGSGNTIHGVTRRTSDDAARGDFITLHYRMDEELYAKNVDVSHRTLPNLISEFQIVRSSTKTLFENITDAQSELPCNIVTHAMSTRAIGYFIIGHARHHLNVLEERYL